ncbi:MAG: hypothetical protein Unbinned4409contig1001_37 [Prokaryotic dsDNA virus sp.]|nr:MAG: hypothetical protein Unbinned4409contig1001_37 [Prokaryotic dsDNA virus sp.]|tara:strand:- start:20498 stop:21709 length:1212 start_codon:yes stop_codon:yes gene_type:complete
MSIAGLTTALGALGGAANIFFGERQRKTGQKLYEDQLDALRSGKFNLGLSGAQTEAANLARQYGEQTARQTGERAAAGQQAALMAARGGDPRMAAGLGSQVAASDQSIRDAQNAALATSVSAQQNLANVQQDLTTQNQLFRQGLEGMEMQRGAAGAEAGRQQLMAGIGQALQSPIMGMQMGVAAKEAGFDDLGDIFNNGGMVTPGPFSHQKNPIHMIDKNGDKVGEATGGEIIFNPKQTEAIEKLIDDGSAQQLMLYMKRLLDQPQFQESTNMNNGGVVPYESKGISISPAVDAFMNLVMQMKDKEISLGSKGQIGDVIEGEPEANLPNSQKELVIALQNATSDEERIRMIREFTDAPSLFRMSMGNKRTPVYMDNQGNLKRMPEGGVGRIIEGQILPNRRGQ